MLKMRALALLALECSRHVGSRSYISVWKMMVIVLCSCKSSVQTLGVMEIKDQYKHYFEAG